MDTKMKALVRSWFPVVFGYVIVGVIIQLFELDLGQLEQWVELLGGAGFKAGALVAESSTSRVVSKAGGLAQVVPGAPSYEALTEDVGD